MRKFDHLRVAFIFKYLMGGGCERVAVNVATRFARWGIASTFISVGVKESEFTLNTEIKDAHRMQGEYGGSPIYLLPNKKKIYTPENKAALGKYLRDHNISVLFVSYLDGRFFDDKLDAPNCRFVYWHHSMPFYELNELRGWDWLPHYSPRKLSFWKLLARKLYHTTPLYKRPIYDAYRIDIKRFDRYLVLCKEYKEEFAETFGLSQAERDKILPITNTIERAIPQKTKQKYIVWVGHLWVFPKRYDRMLEIWSIVQDKLPDWTLRFYGSGDDIRNLIHHKKLKRVEVCGFTNDMSAIYDQAAILCSTSSYEGWPMVIAEAQSRGVVPISFDCCSGVRSMLTSTIEAGVLIKDFDLVDFSHKLIALCKDEDYRSQLQENCLIKSQEYAPEVNDASWMRFFASLS